MAKKRTTPAASRPITVRVRCDDCLYASDPGDNSAYCAVKQHRVCACRRYGRLCAGYQPRATSDLKNSSTQKLKN